MRLMELKRDFAIVGNHSQTAPLCTRASECECREANLPYQMYDEAIDVPVYGSRYKRKIDTAPAIRDSDGNCQHACSGGA